jgi:GNAT superfamily N-acetyltransferase
MHVKEVITKEDIQKFIEVPLSIYAGDPEWVRPLDQDIEAVFDKKKNKYFRHGEAIRWILLDKNQKVIGRTAAFIDRKLAKTFDQPTGGMGFFECIDSKEAAFLLYESCKKWLEERGMQAMDGPVNFGEKDKWWGLLTDGFFAPSYCTNYNPSYYKKLFDAYGFKTYFEQYNYLLKTDCVLPEKYAEKSDRVARDPNYHCEHIRLNALEKYAEDFRTIYNKAWGSHNNFKGMAREQALALIKMMKPIMDEELIWFAYYAKEPIGFFIMLPEINQIIRHLNGKLNWWGKLKFLWYRWRGECRKIFGIAFGIVPEHQSKGVEGFIIMAAARLVQPKGKYEEFEMTWIGDFNPSMIHLVESLGSKKVRTYCTLRKLFDENAPFKRAPIIDK